MLADDFRLAVRALKKHKRFSARDRHRLARVVKIERICYNLAQEKEA